VGHLQGHVEGCQSFGYDQLDEQVALVHVGVDGKQEEVCFLIRLSFGMRVLTAVITVSMPSHSTWTLLVSLLRRVEFSVIDVHTDSRQICWRKRGSDGRAGFLVVVQHHSRQKKMQPYKVYRQIPPFLSFRSLSRFVDNIYI